MSHYLHYWTPLRAQRAFGDSVGPVEFLDNGWFKSLSRGDTLWILSRTADQLVLVLRGDVAAKPRRLETIPSYAVGNSEMFFHHRIRFYSHSTLHPRSVPFAIRDLQRLRFDGRSRRVVGPLNEILVGPLASMRRLQEPTVHVLEAAWKRRQAHPWADLQGPGIATTTAVDLRPPRAKRRVDVTVSRVLRDTATVAALKRLHRNRCQICGKTIALGEARNYSEGHHLRPLGGLHDGPDEAANILIVCPNHHAQLDFAALKISSKEIRQHPEHRLGDEFMAYHNRLVRRNLDHVT